jgi:hypothetical protein
MFQMREEAVQFESDTSDKAAGVFGVGEITATAFPPTETRHFGWLRSRDPFDRAYRSVGLRHGRGNGRRPEGESKSRL